MGIALMLSPKNKSNAKSYKMVRKNFKIMKILETTEDYSLEQDDFYGEVTITYTYDCGNNDDDDSTSSDSGFDDVQNIREYIMSSINDYSR